jgi:hypothetical protein
MSTITKLICCSVVALCLASVSYGFQAELVSGQITGTWVSPLDGSFSVYINTTQVRKFETSTGATIATYTVTAPFCVIIPTNSGQNKNALAVCLAARLSGAPITCSFYPRSSTTAANVTVSGYCDLSY